MRLINADKLAVDARLGEDEIPYVSKTQIDEAPTVEAIPIEWIRNYIEKQKKALRLHDDFNDLDVIWEFIGIETLLEDWEKENEANTD